MPRPDSDHGLRLAPIAVVMLVLLGHSSSTAGRADTLPESLTDRQFWTLIEQISEPDGFFQSNSGSTDNLLSNEGNIATVAAALATRVKGAGVYLGVGPEQNFTYMAAIRPRLAFITDIRRGNLHLHLLYKAVFEMSANRAEFVARLFSRKPIAGVSAQQTAAGLMTLALQAEPLDDAGFGANLQAVTAHLTKTRRLPLDAKDLAGIEYVYRNFHRFGPNIHYTSSINTGRRSLSYATLMASIDARGSERSYLSSEERFTFMKTLQSRNLLVPVVGNFAGPKALRAIGAYLKDRGATVTAFYVSNVEQYLERNGVWSAFCANVAALPLDAASTFVRPTGGSGSFGAMAAESAACGR